MTAPLRCRPAIALAAAFVTILSFGCVVAGGGYGYGYDDGPGYYEPYGAEYGGWRPGYHVAPVLYGGQPHSGGGGHSAPSIPSRPSSHHSRSHDNTQR